VVINGTLTAEMHQSSPYREGNPEVTFLYSSCILLVWLNGRDTSFIGEVYKDDTRKLCWEGEAWFSRFRKETTSKNGSPPGSGLSWSSLILEVY
jgi:hypothetical protein